MSDVATTNRKLILTKRHIAWAVSMLMLCLAVAVLVNGPMAGVITSSSASEDQLEIVKAMPVNVSVAQSVDSIMQTRAYTGTIRAHRNSDLGFELAGKLILIEADEGDRVELGQVLANLDTETLAVQLEATQARLAQSRSVLKELEAGPRLEKIRAANASVKAAESLHANAVANLDRREQLKNVQAISPEEFDTASYGVQTALANLNVLKERLAELKSGTRTEQLEAQKSVVTQLESAAKEIDVAISKSTLIAPYAGTITRRYLDNGSVVQASAPVVRLVEDGHLEAWVGLPVAVAAKFDVGSEHNLFVNDQSFLAKTTARIQELDPTTRTQTVVFKLAKDASKQLVSGQLCEIRVENQVDVMGVEIPTSALAKGIRGLWSVLVVVPKTDEPDAFLIEKRDINIIKTDSDRVIVNGSLEAGDQIVVDGVHRVGSGQLVKPIHANVQSSGE